MKKFKLAICFILFSIFIALSYKPILAAEDKWFWCKKNEEYKVINGAGGWPVAVNIKHVGVYNQWLHEVRSFTEFYQIGDCFQAKEEIVSYIELAKQNLSCEKMRCEIMTQPVCTIEGAGTVAPNI